MCHLLSDQRRHLWSIFVTCQPIVLSFVPSVADESALLLATAGHCVTCQREISAHLSRP